MTRLAGAAAVVILGLCNTASGLTGSGDSPVGVLDTLAPQVSGLQVSQSLAEPGDTVTITFTLSESPAGLPTVTVNGSLAAFVSETGGVYTYTYLVGPSDPGGPALLQINSADAVGNVGQFTDASVLSLKLPPLPLHTWAVFVVLVVLGVLFVRRLRKTLALMLLAALCAAPPAWGQAPVVSNVNFVQQARESGGTEVIITYDLESPSCTCDITVWLSKDAGEDGFAFPVTSVTGDTTLVTPGTGKRIVWDIAADYPGEYISQAQIRVTAETRPTDLSAWESAYPACLFSNAARCQNNLKLVGLVGRLYSETNAGAYLPRLSDEPGRLMLREDEIYPEFCTFEPKTLTCPGRAPETPEPYFDDTHYVYLGYTTMNDQDVVAFADAYMAEIAAGGDFSGDLPGTTSYGDVIYRLSQHVGFLVTDINDGAAAAQAMAQIPVMFDWPDNHQAGWGGNVLFLDGHVEFKHYPNEFPMTETTIATLADLAGYVPPEQWNNPYLYSPYPLSEDPHGFVISCSNNIKQVDLSIRKFTNESAGEVYPALSSEPGRLMMTDDGVYPEYLGNPGLLTCPGAAKIMPTPYFDDPHYVYLGYMVRNDEDVAAFAAAYAAVIAAGGDFTSDLPVTTSYGDTLYRLREGVWRFLVGDINDPTDCVPPGKIPIFWEWPDNHEGLSGGNVLYMDGHVEWQNYPGEFPMSEGTVAALSALAGHTPATTWAEPTPAYLPENDPYGFVRTCSGHLASVRATCWIFGNESAGGVWPKLSNVPGNLMMTEEEVYPQYLMNPEVLVCPGPAPVTPEPFLMTSTISISVTCC